MYKQSPLPGLPDGAQKIGIWLSILRKDGSVTYFLGGDNYFSHPIGDRKSERFALTSLMENGHVRACDPERPPLGIPHRTLMHWKAQCRKDGPASFFRTVQGPKPAVMTPEKSAECAGLIADGRRPSEVARLAGIKESTLRKALKRQDVPRLTRNAAADGPRQIGASKSERSRADAERRMAWARPARAPTNGSPPRWAWSNPRRRVSKRGTTWHDVQMAGLLAGLPALCANGLLTGLGKHLKLPNGFYSALHILLTLGFMALGRIRRPEGLRHVPPGELGKVIGLDRVPEVRTLRQKIAVMATVVPRSKSG